MRDAERLRFRAAGALFDGDLSGILECAADGVRVHDRASRDRRLVRSRAIQGVWIRASRVLIL